MNKKILIASVIIVLTLISIFILIPKEQTINLNRFKESIQQHSKGFETMSETSVDLSKETLIIPAKSSMIIELK